MSKPRMFLKIAAATACVAWGLSAMPAMAQDVTLKFATISAESTRGFKEVLEPLARGIEKDSAGRIKVDLRGSGPNGFGKPAELFDMVERGDVDVAFTVQGYKPGRFPRTTVAELPLMFRDSQEGTRVVWQLYKEGMLEKEYDGLKVLSLYAGVPSGIFSATKPIAALKDLRGMRLRVASPTVGLSLARLGAVPIGLPINIIGESIASGMVDGLAFGADSMETLPGVNGKPVAEQVKAFYDCGFAEVALMIVMNQKAYDSLPKDLQKVLDDHFSVADVQAMAKDRDVTEGDAKKRFQGKSGFTYTSMTPDQHDEMVKLIAPVLDDWKKSLAAQGIDADKLLKRAQELAAQKTASAN
jgi:TRAP-type C4-dicarboxylate transport system substrate-binding protein